MSLSHNFESDNHDNSFRSSRVAPSKSLCQTTTSVSSLMAGQFGWGNCRTCSWGRTPTHPSWICMPASTVPTWGRCPEAPSFQTSRPPGTPVPTVRASSKISQWQFDKKWHWIWMTFNDNDIQWQWPHDIQWQWPHDIQWQWPHGKKWQWPHDIQWQWPHGKKWQWPHDIQWQWPHGKKWQWPHDIQWQWPHDKKWQWPHDIQWQWPHGKKWQWPHDKKWHDEQWTTSHWQLICSRGTFNFGTLKTACHSASAVLM